MKIEKISENMIRVTISLRDLEERNIDFSALNYNSPAAQELFWDMMEQAEEQYGFNVADSQLIIEPSPGSDDGVIITISRIGDEGDFESIQKYIKSKLKKSDLKVKKKSRRVTAALSVYAFKSLDDITMLSKRLENIYYGENTLYKCRSTYYLVLSRNNISVGDARSFDMFLDEYGKKMPNFTFMEGYLNEYGEKLIEYNALEIIKNYF